MNIWALIEQAAERAVIANNQRVNLSFCMVLQIMENDGAKVKEDLLVPC